MTVEFLDEYGALDGLWASSGVLGGRRNKILFNLFELAGAALLGVDRFEMVAHDVGGDYFHVAREGVGVLLLERTEDAEVISTEFEVGFLEEVVNRLFGSIAESAGGAQDDGGDEAVETTDELLPGFRAAGCGAAADEFLNRYGGGSLHYFHRCVQSPHFTGFFSRDRRVRVGGRGNLQGLRGEGCRNFLTIVVYRYKTTGAQDCRTCIDARGLLA